MNVERAFKSFSKLLHVLATSGLSIREFRNYLVQSCETSDILVLLDALDDLLAKTKET